MGFINRVIVPWTIPLVRTFLAGFGTALAAGAADVTSVPAVWAIITGAAVAGVNAIVLLVQRALPGVPDPRPPA